ncbi:MAG TPA: hypothetical protein VME92_12920 [Acetobacteraceae bacterium]|nr:hypothetical protein [Acetobacteraceae bacterium]
MRRGWDWLRSDGWRQPWPAALILACVLVASGALIERMSLPARISAPAGTGRSHFLAYLAAAAFGTLVGATELVARYRDKPSAPLQTLPGLVYIGVNGAVSLIVFWLLRTGQIATGTVAGLGPALNQVLVAGFGSMALFRTSLFRMRVKDTDIAVGPAAVLQVILDAADRACDRLRAGPRAQEVKRIMAGICYAPAKSALVLHCLALMQNLSATDKDQLSQAIAVLDAAAMSDEVKAYNLGLVLINFVGEDVLREAVQALDSLIRGPAPDLPPIFSQADSLELADLPPLVSLCAALDPTDREQQVATLRAAWLAVDPVLHRQADANVVVLARLRRYFGPETLSRALAVLTASKAPVQKVEGPLNLGDLAPAPAPAAKPPGGGEGRPAAEGRPASGSSP